MNRSGTRSVVYTFDGFKFDVDARVICSPDGDLRPLNSKAFETLLYLVEHPGRVIERDEIMAVVWPDTIVEENNLTQQIASLRRFFGETPSDHVFFTTVRGHGYKFTADVIREEVEKGSDADTPRLGVPAPRFRKWVIALATAAVAAFLLLGYFYQRGRTGHTSGSIRSLAVLPFRPISELDENFSFEMGLTNELIAKLAETDGLSVRSFHSVKRFASGDQDPIEAGRALGVDAVLESSVQTSSGRIRISVRLIRVADQKQLWTAPFENERTEAFDAQDAIAERVASEVVKRLRALDVADQDPEQ